MLVSVCKLEDESKKPLCSFNLGEHMIGRGPSLQCQDKRISRKHLQIDVFDQTATITAKHEINPCFYRAAEGKHISILKYNVPVDLNDGDKFGFFPDQYWFEIKISFATQINGITNGNFVNQIENITSEESKVQTVNNIINTNVVGDYNLSENIEHRNGVHCDGIGNEADVTLEVCNLNRSEVQDDCNVNTSHAPADSNFDGGNTAKLNNYCNTGDVNDCNNVGEVDETKIKTEDTPGESCFHSGGDRVNILPTLDIHPANTTNCDTATTLQNDIETEINQTQHLMTVKEEVMSDDEGGEGCSTSNTDTNINAVQIKTEADVKQEVTDDGDATATLGSTSCSTTDANRNSNPPKTYKDRCWYGSVCYRRNGVHKTQFTHPGDPDYDTDPEDDRPPCQYGGSCFRRNGEHRRDFKHSRFMVPMAPTQQVKVKTDVKVKKEVKTNRKRKNGNTASSSNSSDDEDPAGVSPSNVVNTKRRRNDKKMVDSPMDDYDYNDPFLDDSSEEFMPMDSESSESD